VFPSSRFLRAWPRPIATKRPRSPFPPFPLVPSRHAARHVSHVLSAVIDLSQQIRRYRALVASICTYRTAPPPAQRAGRCTPSGVIKEHIFPSLSDFDLIFIAPRRGRARRRDRGPFGRNITQFLRLIRTFKAVNEDWPHIPSARSLLPHPPLRPFGRAGFCVLPVRSGTRVRACVRADTSRALHAAGALMAQIILHPERILLYYYY